MQMLMAGAARSGHLPYNNCHWGKKRSEALILAKWT